MIGLLAAAAAGRQQPDDTWRQLGTLRRTLEAEGVGEFDPEGMRRFRDRFDRLRLQQARRFHRFPFPGDSRDEAFEAAALEGRTLLYTGARARERLLEDQLNRIGRMDRMIQELQKANFTRQSRIDSRRIAFRLKEAQRLWWEGRYRETARVLEEIETLRSDLERTVDLARRRYEDAAQLKQWRGWLEETADWSRRQARDALVVVKYDRTAGLYRQGRIVAEFPVELGWGGLVDKLRQGDGATPEGRYRVVAKKSGPETKFHLALLLDYPNSLDHRAFRVAKREGRIHENSRIGGLIEVHGEGGRGTDWTDGCVALRNEDMEEVFAAAYPGMPVTIVGRLQ